VSTSFCAIRFRARSFRLRSSWTAQLEVGALFSTLARAFASFARLMDLHVNDAGSIFATRACFTGELKSTSIAGSPDT